MWKEYPNDPRYEVSNLGQVRMKGRKPRKPSIGKSGYHQMILSVPGQKHVGRYVHRMVLETFVGPCPEGMEVSHLNGNRADNRLLNLCYESPSANHFRKVEHNTAQRGERASWAKLTEAQVREIRASAETEPALAQKFGVSRSQIGRVRRGERWGHVLGSP